MTQSQFSYRNENPRLENPTSNKEKRSCRRKKENCSLSSLRCTGNLGVHKTRV